MILDDHELVRRGTRSLLLGQPSYMGDAYRGTYRTAEQIQIVPDLQQRSGFFQNTGQPRTLTFTVGYNAYIPVDHVQGPTTCTWAGQAETMGRAHRAWAMARTGGAGGPIRAEYTIPEHSSSVTE